MMALRKKFVADFSQHGYGFVQGSKWKSMTHGDTFSQRSSDLTYEQILDKEKSEKNARAKLDIAKELGEGTETPGQHLGWYRDRSRGGAPVYLYGEGVVHVEETRTQRGLKTQQETDRLSMEGAPFAMLTQGKKRPCAVGNGSSSSAVPVQNQIEDGFAGGEDDEDDQEDNQVEETEEEGGEGEEEQHNDDTEEENFECSDGELKKKAEQMLADTRAHACLSGFHEQLDALLKNWGSKRKAKNKEKLVAFMKLSYKARLQMTCTRHYTRA